MQAWAESLGGISYPLLSDFWPHGSIASLYGVLRTQDGFSERAIFVLDKRGVIRYIDIHPIDDRPDNDVLRQVLAQIEAEQAAATLPAVEDQPAARRPEVKRTGVVELPASEGVYFESADDVAVPRGEIVLYCAYWCKDCRKARAWLDERGLNYVEVDIDSNVDARRQVRAWSGGKLITPIIEFDGAVILDYDPAKLEEALQKRLH